VNFKQIPLLLTISIWYLIFTTVLSIAQYYIERHYGRGTARAQSLTPLQRLRRSLLIRHARVPRA
jgi:polar amino acid transport system permease protein